MIGGVFRATFQEEKRREEKEKIGPERTAVGSSSFLPRALIDVAVARTMRPGS